MRGLAPEVCSVLLALLMGVSLLRSGSVSPPAPQIAGNEGYRQLWLGNSGGGAGAVAAFRGALVADPAFPYRWSDLGEALLTAGDPAGARYCFGRALELGPNDPQVQLRAANFHFRQGDAGAALRLGFSVLQRVSAHDEIVFSSYMRLGGGRTGGLERVLDLGIGSNARAAGEFFRFLSRQGPSGGGSPKDLETAWNWMEGHGLVEPGLARSRATWLLSHDMPARAAEVWSRHLTPAGSSWRRRNEIEDPGFESDWTGEGFDWRSEPTPDVSVDRDRERAHSGRASLRLRFHAAGNVDLHPVSQTVWLGPGAYRLSTWMRAEGVSEEQGVSLRVVPKRPGAGAPLAATGRVGGSGAWKEFSAGFQVEGGHLLAEVQVAWAPSLKFSTRPRGTVWVDDVTLSRIL